jgi:hypothetical protein
MARGKFGFLNSCYRARAPLLWFIFIEAVEMAQKEEKQILHVIPGIYDLKAAPDEKRALLRVFAQNLGVV